MSLLYQNIFDISIRFFAFFRNNGLLSIKFFCVTLPHMSIIEGDITTFNTFQFNGRLKKDFFSAEEKEALDDREYALWKELREFCLSLIKGKRTPLGFHFVLSMSAPNIARLLEQEHLSFAPADVQGLYLNFKYDGTKLSCTTGTSMNLFTLDKSLEQAWDKMAQRIFAKYEIPFEVE